MKTLNTTIVDICEKSKEASRQLATLSTDIKNKVLATTASFLESEKEYIQIENQKDIDEAQGKGLSKSLLERLQLSDKVISSMVKGLEEVKALPDPIGGIASITKRPNGLMVGRMRIPLGVVSMIYESRPNVTVDAAALCIKTGNSVILRGGSEAIRSNIALGNILQRAMDQYGVNPDGVQIIPTTDRDAIKVLIEQQQYIDLVIPRGGEGLVHFVAENARVPVLKHYKGVCHIFVDKDADLKKAIPLITNAKTHRPGVCNALEGLLIHEAIAAEFVPQIHKALKECGVSVLGCEKSVEYESSIEVAAEDDWGREFLDLYLCMKVVDDYFSAKSYIENFGSQHTECILTENYSLAQKFIREIDASAVMVNASTRFNDGGELGLGAEIGISTSKLHAYGPMGLEELTTRKFVIYGEGQVRV